MYRDMTRGSITRSLLLFALPMMAGSLLQQLYNVADTLIVGRALGRDALAAVGSAFTLMTFLTSIFLGLAMGAGALFAICIGRGDMASLRRAAALALCLIGAVTAVLTGLVYALLSPVLRFLQIPEALLGDMGGYLRIIFAGLAATFLYNYFACLLRSAGNSAAPLWFLGGAALLNVGLDLLFVLVCRWGVSGVAAATVIAQYTAGLGLAVYALRRCRELLPRREDFRFDRRTLRELLDLRAQRSDLVFEAARITQRDVSNWSSTLVLNRGSRHGVAENDCAVDCYGNLVGVVTEVGLNWCRLTTILGTGSQLGAMVFRTEETAIAAGDLSLMTEGRLKLSYLPDSSTLIKGDLVVTSGLGGYYPSGLPIGSVEEVRTDDGGLARYAVLTPRCDPDALTDLYIITDFDVVE